MGPEEAHEILPQLLAHVHAFPESFFEHSLELSSAREGLLNTIQAHEQIFHEQILVQQRAERQEKAWDALLEKLDSIEKIDPSETTKEKNPKKIKSSTLALITEIPDSLHSDKVFSKYICTINRYPIRYIVADPVANDAFYERSAIVRWLNDNPASPATRQALQVDQLIKRSDIQSIIDKRLRTLISKQAVQIVDVEDLTDLAQKIEEWSNDSTLKQLIDYASCTSLPAVDLREICNGLLYCNLTNKPIRYIATPKGGGACYEKAELLAYLRKKQAPKYWPEDLPFKAKNICYPKKIQQSINESLDTFSQDLAKRCIERMKSKNIFIRIAS